MSGGCRHHAPGAMHSAASERRPGSGSETGKTRDIAIISNRIYPRGTTKREKYCISCEYSGKGTQSAWSRRHFKKRVVPVAPGPGWRSDDDRSRLGVFLLVVIGDCDLCREDHPGNRCRVLEGHPDDLCGVDDTPFHEVLVRPCLCVVSK